MTERQPLLLYVPLLHKELADEPGIGRTARAPIYTLWPGLPPASSSLPEAPGWQLYKPSFPYSPLQALSCLNDWKTLAAEQGPDALALPHNAPKRHDSALDPGEELALEAFSRTGTAAFGEKDTNGEKGTNEPHGVNGSPVPPVPPAPQTAPPHTEAQQRLLMVWLQEEHVIDIKKLIKQYHLNAAALATTLADTLPQSGESETALSVSSAPLSEDMTGDLADVLLPQGLFPDDASSLLPPWNFVLENMAPFLPDNCILYSADARMWEDLQERGVRFEPLPPEDEMPQPEAGGEANAGEALPRVVRQHLTLWELLGKKNPVPEAPWLNARHEFRFVLTATLLPTP